MKGTAWCMTANNSFPLQWVHQEKVPFLFRQIKQELFYAKSVTSAITEETGHEHETYSN